MSVTLQATKVPLKVVLNFTKDGADEPDVVRFDFTGKGTFEKDSAVALRKVADQRAEHYAEFGPATVNARRDGKTFPVAVRGIYAKLKGRRQVGFTFAAAMEGKCQFGRKEYPVRLIDNTGEFRFDDKGKFDRKQRGGMGLSSGDTVLIDTGDGSFTRSVIKAYCGQPVFLDGAWHEVTASADGTKVSARRIDLKFGQVVMDRDKWEAVLVSDGKAFYVCGGRDPVAVPAGKYDLLYYREWSAPDAAGNRSWLLAASMEFLSQGKTGEVVTVAAGKTARLPFGSPLQADFSAKVTENRTVEFSIGSPRDRGGLAVAMITRPGGWIVSAPDAPVVTILDGKGKRVAAVTLEYG